MRRSKKIINDPSNVVTELLEGLVLASHGRLRKLDNINAVVKSETEDKVGIVFGCGSGHEPLASGLIGFNLADGAACGNVFAAPTPDVILETMKAVDKGKGVLNLVFNYAGDNMNFDFAIEMARAEGIVSRTIRIQDDIASAPKERKGDRRGIAGYLLVLKIAGAITSETDDLDEICRVTEKARDHVRSMGIALSAGSMPETGRPSFQLSDNEIEIGLGIHGEPGVHREVLTKADDLVEGIISSIINDLPFKKNDRVCLLINNLGSTTNMELLIVCRIAHKILKNRGIFVHDTLIGAYCTSLEMAGISISLMKVDEELINYYNFPVRSFAFCKFQLGQ